MSSTISLKERHSDATRDLILDTAVELLRDKGFAEVNVRAVAKLAGMSERTIFRYFPTRDDFLDAIAVKAAAEMRPPQPDSIETLPAYPAALYRSFEEKADLVAAVLHTELFKRVRVSAAPERWAVVASMIDAYAPKRSKKERENAATNINYFLSASTWHYYRFTFELSAKDTVACARRAIEDTLRGLKT